METQNMVEKTNWRRQVTRDDKKLFVLSFLLYVK